jgi:hypothetical protein
MTPEDKEFARTCLEKKWLSIEQVEEIRRTSEEKKLAFREVAVAYGVVREKPGADPSAPVWPYVIAGTLAVFAVGAILSAVATIAAMSRDEIENAKARAAMEAKEPPHDPSAGAATAEQSRAELQLRHAREAIRFVELNGRSIPEGERVTRLEEALMGVERYLAIHPESATVLCDRARARDLLGRLPDALADYERAMQMEPQLARDIAPRVRLIRETLGKSDR